MKEKPLGEKLNTELSFATCYPLHFHAPRLDATFGQPLLCNYAANVVCKDEVGLQDGQGFGVWVRAGLMDDYVQCPAVVLYAGHLHVLFREGETKRRENQKRQKGLDRLKKVVEGGRRIEKISSRREQIKKTVA